MTTNYYIHSNDFECDDVTEYVMPSDIKRIISHNQHTFYKRIYFFSPSERQIYRYLPMFCGCSETIKAYKVGKSLKFNLLTDENKHDSIYVSDRLIARTSGMSKIELK